MDLDFFDKHVPAFLLVVFLSISVFFLTARLNHRVLAVKKLIMYIVIPTPQRLSGLISYSQGMSRNLLDLFKAHEENITIKKKLRSLILREPVYFQLSSENERLRELLEFKRTSPFKFLSAFIIGREPSHWFQSFLINRGSDKGIRKNASVIAIQGGRAGLIGRVFYASKHAANILLLTDSLSAVAVTCRRSDSDGVIEGANTSSLRLNYIVPDADIKVGDAIVTSGVGGIFPPGLLIGHIESIDSDQEGYFLTAQVMSAINYNQLREVVILAGDENGEEE